MEREVNLELIENREFKYIESHILKASRLTQAGDYQGAADELTHAISEHPGYELYNERGVVFSLSGKFQEAIHDFSYAISLDPDRADAYNNRGIVFVKKKKFDLAIRDFSRAIQIHPRDPVSYSNRGGAYHEKGSYQLATQDYSKAMELEGPQPA